MNRNSHELPIKSIKFIFKSDLSDLHVEKILATVIFLHVFQKDLIIEKRWHNQFRTLLNYQNCIVSDEKVFRYNGKKQFTLKVEKKENFHALFKTFPTFLMGNKFCRRIFDFLVLLGHLSKKFKHLHKCESRK